MYLACWTASNLTVDEHQLSRVISRVFCNRVHRASTAHSDSSLAVDVCLFMVASDGRCLQMRLLLPLVYPLKPENGSHERRLNPHLYLR